MYLTMVLTCFVPCFRQRENNRTNMGKNSLEKNEFRAKPKCSDGGKNQQIKPDLYSLFTFNVFLSFLIKSL